jgi:hypothetical protein
MFYVLSFLAGLVLGAAIGVFEARRARKAGHRACREEYHLGLIEGRRAGRRARR